VNMPSPDKENPNLYFIQRSARLRAGEIPFSS